MCVLGSLHKTPRGLHGGLQQNSNVMKTSLHVFCSRSLVAEWLGIRSTSDSSPISHPLSRIFHVLCFVGSVHFLLPLIRRIFIEEFSPFPKNTSDCWNKSELLVSWLNQVPLFPGMNLYQQQTTRCGDYHPGSITSDNTPGPYHSSWRRHCRVSLLHVSSILHWSTRSKEVLVDLQVKTDPRDRVTSDRREHPGIVGPLCRKCCHTDVCVFLFARPSWIAGAQYTNEKSCARWSSKTVCPGGRYNLGRSCGEGGNMRF